MKQVNEGVRFGEQQIDDILSRSKDFNIGVEYEIRLTEKQKEDLIDNLKEWGLHKDIHEIVPEHDDMTEIITKKMPLSSALKHIKGIFEMVTTHNIEIPEVAGMHISVSTNKYLLDHFNALKFYLLMNSEYIHRVFPERGHVGDSYSRIRDIIEMDVYYSNSYNLDDLKNSIRKGKTKEVEKIIKQRIPTKYQTINISDYESSNGRIELRFFGGGDYHELYSDIKRHLLRALLLLEMAYTDLYHQEYLKKLSALTQDVEAKMSNITPKEEVDNNRTKLLTAISEGNHERIIQILKYSDIGIPPNNLPPKITAKLKNMFKTVPHEAVEYAEVTRKAFSEAESVIAQDGKASYAYATRVLNGRFLEGEEAIISDSLYSSHYIKRMFGKSRLSQSLENILVDAENPSDWYEYISNLDDRGSRKFPSLSTEKTIALTNRIDALKLKELVELNIVNKDNINNVLEAMVVNPDSSMDLRIHMLVVAYKEVNGLTEVDIDSDLRVKLIKRSYSVGEVVGTLSTKEKITMVDSMTEFLADLSGKDRQEILDNLTKSITHDTVNIVRVLKPYGEDFIKEFKNLTGNDLPPESGVSNE